MARRLKCHSFVSNPAPALKITKKSILIRPRAQYFCHNCTLGILDSIYSGNCQSFIAAVSHFCVSLQEHVHNISTQAHNKHWLKVYQLSSAFWLFI